MRNAKQITKELDRLAQAVNDADMQSDEEYTIAIDNLKDEIHNTIGFDKFNAAFAVISRLGALSQDISWEY